MASLRLTPNFSTWRPCDQVEAAVGWKLAIERQHGPTALILSRQNLAQVERTPEQVKAIARGGYILKDSGGKPDIILNRYRIGNGNYPPGGGKIDWRGA
ncbi:transketolase 2 [Salmonella enterica subsp. enterica serovar Havana]|nr:transketolase 2 [Salmonella enterica subsp. enterica serovar Havana]